MAWNKKFIHWVHAARPQTLPASVTPVLIGSILAWSHGLFSPAASLIALFCALAIQIGTNFANDYYDYKKGADNDDRIGFTRMTAAGLIRPNAMLRATITTMLIAFIAGLYLVWIGGWVIFWIGVFSILFGILYTGGPFPLGYNGLGDLFVFIFFGLVAVAGTYYVNALSWSAEAFWLSLPIGALCVNILVVNNLRDVEQDRISGKRTLGVMFGERVLKGEYLVMLLLAYLTLPILNLRFDYNTAIYLPLLGLPYIAFRLRTVWSHQQKQELNQTLEQTAKFMVVFGLLLATGIYLQSL